MQPPTERSLRQPRGSHSCFHRGCSGTGHRPRRTACIPTRLGEAKSSSSSSSTHPQTDNFFRHSFQTSPLEVPKPRSTDLPLPGSSSCRPWQTVTGYVCTDSSLPVSFPRSSPALSACSPEQSGHLAAGCAQPSLPTAAHSGALGSSPQSSGAVRGTAGAVWPQCPTSSHTFLTSQPNTVSCSPPS